MFEFYEFNTINIVIVFSSTFVIYNILHKLLNNNIDNDDDNKNESKFNFEYLLIAGIVSISISLIISYILAEKYESILTGNYWDPVNELNSLDNQ
tara:strand:- start:23 stop:307 length:285 start_codon:yes stop_codon:yes gene_type:complete